MSLRRRQRAQCRSDDDHNGTMTDDQCAQQRVAIRENGDNQELQIVYAGRFLEVRGLAMGKSEKVEYIAEIV